jgi:serine protease Do
MHNKMKVGFFCSALLTVAAISWRFLPSANVGHLLAQQATSAEQEEDLISADRLSNSFRNAAKTLRPSVVTITSSIERTSRRFQGLEEQFGPLSPQDLFDLEELLGRNRRGLPRAEEEGFPKERIESGKGSGVIVSSDGYVLTNNHVVEDADQLKVELSDGRTFDAEIVGTDDKSDVAVLKVNATGLVPARLGDSSKLEVGDWVIAVGSPFGLDQTVTAGIISAMNRQTGILSGGYEDFLQTDAAINPGNSGGPLVSLRGEVIGINTAINSRTGTNAGVGFAIPSNMAARIMEDLRTTGRVVRGFIGARIEDVTSENVQLLNLPEGITRGALIETVLDGGPADNSSLKAGDVVTAINGRPIVSRDQLRNTVALTRPGSKLNFEVYRNGKIQPVNVLIGELTPEKMDKLSGRVEIPDFGITVETFSPEWAEELRVSEDTRGAVIINMLRGGKAAQLRLQPGDVITEVNGKAVASADDAEKQLNAAGEKLRMLIKRGNVTAIVTAS